MSAIDELITDRTLSDVQRAASLTKKGFANMTSSEKDEWLAGMKGCYNSTDMNRVEESVLFLRQRIAEGMGISLNLSQVPYYRVEPVEGASYGFELNQEGYYESNNKSIFSSAALCKVVFNDLGVGALRIKYINYAEPGYDYGIIGAVDNTLGTTYIADSTGYVKKLSDSADCSATEKEYSFETQGAAEHFFYVKFRKDPSVNEFNDSFKFKIDFRFNKWKMGNLITNNDSSVYLSKVTTIKNGFPLRSSVPTLPTSLSGLNYIGANNIEKVLKEVDFLSINCLNANNLYYSGEIDSGGEF